MVRLVPRETKFFELFENMSSNLTKAARLLAETLGDMENVQVRVRQLSDLEHIGDDITHTILTRLNQTFITPFDREDIHKLASSLDDVLDFIHAAGERLVMYKIGVVPPAAAELAHIIIRQTEELAIAVAMLEKHDHVLEHCVEVNRLENEADTVARENIGKLFEREKDPITLIKLKELYEVLETATDKAEDAANVLESVVLKGA
jgi:predicted phosphate transport protein (TIGR00153 family)